MKREQIEEKRNFSKEERLEMIEKRINFLKQKLKKIEPNDARKQRIESKISFLSKRKENFEKRKQENNQSSSNKPRKQFDLKEERTANSPQTKIETKMERIEKKINKFNQILENPQTQQNRKEKIETKNRKF